MEMVAKTSFQILTTFLAVACSSCLMAVMGCLLVMAYSCRDGLDILSRRFRFDLKYASDLDRAGTGTEARPVLFFYPLSEADECTVRKRMSLQREGG